MKHLLMCLIWLALSEPSCAKARTDYLPEDSIHVMTAEESDTLNTPAKKKSLITRFLDYFNDANNFFFGLVGQVGLEYTFWFPLQLSADLRPTLGICDGEFWTDGLFGFVPTLSVRYSF